MVPGRRFTLVEADDQDPPTWSEVGGTQTLDELLRRTPPAPGGPVVALAFGPGLTLYAGLLRAR